MRRKSPRQPSPPPVDGLVVSGLTELAVGALTGWLYALAIADPEKAKALGIRSVPRLRQWHLDLIALGGLTVLTGTALPDLPSRVKLPLGIGAWTNAMSFAVLMFDPPAKDKPLYRGAVGGSFILTSTGFVGAAREGFKRWRQSR
jgi:hypothetical protein